MARATILSISLCVCGLVCEKFATLTSSQNTINGARIHLIDGYAIESNKWIFTDNFGDKADANRFVMQIILNYTIWGFHPRYNSSITIDLNGSTLSSDFDPLFVFSVVNSSKYIATLIRLDNGYSGAEYQWADSMVHPICGNAFAPYDPEVLGNGQYCYHTLRLLDPYNSLQNECNLYWEGANINDSKLQPPQSESGNWSNTWPLRFIITNYPNASAIKTELQYISNGHTQTCAFSESFGAHFGNNNLNIFIATNDDGESFTISRINITYSEESIITQEPTNDPSQGPSIITDEPSTASQQATEGPSPYPTSDPLVTSTSTQYESMVNMTPLFYNTSLNPTTTSLTVNDLSTDVDIQSTAATKTAVDGPEDVESLDESTNWLLVVLVVAILFAICICAIFIILWRIYCPFKNNEKEMDAEIEAHHMEIDHEREQKLVCELKNVVSELKQGSEVLHAQDIWRATNNEEEVEIEGDGDDNKEAQEDRDALALDEGEFIVDGDDETNQ